VEDHPTFRAGLVQTLRSEADLVICGQTGTADEGLRAIRQLKPDLVVLDISLPGMSGLELIKALRAEKCLVKILVLSMHDEAFYAARVLGAGGDGYIMKEEDPEEIVLAIRDVLAGHIYVSEEVLASTPKGGRKGGSKAKVSPLDQLSDLELKVLELLGYGRTNQEIARQMGLSVKTVVAHCARMKRGLKLKSENALIRYAVCWVETDTA